MDHWGAPVSLRSELRKAFTGTVFRRYRCTGKECTFEVAAMEGLEIFCPNPKCRGRATPRRVVPINRMVEAALAGLEPPEAEIFPGLQGHLLGVSPSQEAQESPGDKECPPEISEASTTDFSTDNAPEDDSPPAPWKEAG
jgi:hypothetical protein